MTYPKDAERRRHPRAEDLATTAVVLARHDDGVVCVIESIALGGARLIGPLALQVGESIQIVFELEGGPIQVRATVIRADNLGVMIDRIAVAFEGLDDAAKEQIKQFVRRALELEDERGERHG